MRLGDLKLSRSSFRSQAVQDREYFIKRSLASSASLLAQLTAGSGNGDRRTRPIVLKFHQEWQHPDCNVMQWYNEQRTRSTTEFRSIEHRKNVDPPFNHEFLLIQLTDGSCCRLERVGDGSRPEAVRRMGCASHDMIKWFPPGQYDSDAASQTPQEVVVQVDFPQSFDLIDVFAICYSIQKCQRTSVYTLQRFNCYFLCCTVLAVLTRRVEEWETMITPEDWTNVVNHALSELTNRKHKASQPVEYLSLGICALLRPGNPTPDDFILDSLRTSFGADAHNSFNNEVPDILWHNDLHLAVKKVLPTFLDGAVRAVMAADNSRSSELRDLLTNAEKESYRPRNIDLLSTKKTMSKAFKSGISVLMEEEIEPWRQRYRMQQLEGRHSLPTRFLVTVCAALVIYPISLYCLTSIRRKDKEVAKQFKKFQVSTTQMYLSLPITMAQWGKYILLTQRNGSPQDGESFDFKAVISKHWAECLVGMLVNLDNSEPSSREDALAILNGYVHEKLWTNCLNNSVLNEMGKCMNNATVQGPKTLTVHTREGVEESWNATDFQDHLHNRIEAHALRTESVKLAAAPLVLADIKSAISEIWRSLPKGSACPEVQSPPNPEN